MGGEAKYLYQIRAPLQFSVLVLNPQHCRKCKTSTPSPLSPMSSFSYGIKSKDWVWCKSQKGSLSTSTKRLTWMSNLFRSGKISRNVQNFISPNSSQILKNKYSGKIFSNLPPWFPELPWQHWGQNIETRNQGFNLDWHRCASTGVVTEKPGGFYGFKQNLCSPLKLIHSALGSVISNKQIIFVFLSIWVRLPSNSRKGCHIAGACPYRAIGGSSSICTQLTLLWKV